MKTKQRSYYINYEANSIIASRLKYRRRLLGMTQQEVAKATGISYSSICEYENNIHPILAVNLYKLSKLYKVPTDYFFKKLYVYKPVKNKKEEVSETSPIRVDYAKEEIYDE